MSSHPNTEYPLTPQTHKVDPNYLIPLHITYKTKKCQKGSKSSLESKTPATFYFQHRWLPWVADLPVHLSTCWLDQSCGRVLIWSFLLLLVWNLCIHMHICCPYSLPATHTVHVAQQSSVCSSIYSHILHTQPMHCPTTPFCTLCIIKALYGTCVCM